MLEIVRKLSSDRKNRNVEPAVAGENEVIREITSTVREILKSLVEDNVLGCYDNINYIKMYYPISKDTKEVPNDDVSTPGC